MTKINGKLVAVLQRRGEFNHQKMAPESWPGACQVTVHGRVKETDPTLMQALAREFHEEMGFDFFSIPLLEGVSSSELGLLKTSNETVATFGALLSAELFFQNLRLNASAGGLRLLEESEVSKIVDIKGFDKAEGVLDRRTIAMFPDEIEAVKSAFREFPLVV